MSETAEVLYKTTDYYAPASEKIILWNDPTLAIDWHLSDFSPTLSSKDAQGLLFRESAYFK
jgi:dTDP-4-dehydrorhamnose 3,5-epimerase